MGAKKSLGRVFGTQAGPADREAPSQPRLSFPLCALGCGSQNLVLVWKPAESTHALSPPCRGCFEVTWSSLLRGGERPARVWGWLCLCSQERKKKKSRKPSSKARPRCLPRLPRVPRAQGAPQPGTNPPASAQPAPEIPNFSFFFLFFCLSEAGFVSFSVEKGREGGSSLRRARAGALPARVTAVPRARKSQSRDLSPKRGWAPFEHPSETQQSP